MYLIKYFKPILFNIRSKFNRLGRYKVYKNYCIFKLR